MQVFVNSPRHSCLLRTLSPHRGGLSNTHWLHRFVASPPPPSSLASSSLASPDIGISRLTSTCGNPRFRLHGHHHHLPWHITITALIIADLPLCFCAPSASNTGLCSFASCSLPLLVLAAAATYCICWEHPTLAPAVLTGTALLQLLLQLCLSCYSAADCTDFAGC